MTQPLPLPSPQPAAARVPDAALMANPAYGDLHLLTVLGQTRSYTQAARRLGLSKATVSLRIAELERAAGVALVQRSTRSVALTAAGQQLMDETAPAFSRIAQSFAAVRDLASTPRGLVRLSAPVALGRQHVAPMLASFLRAHPQIRIELDLNDRLVNLAQEGFDLAVRHVQTAPDSYVAWTLCETRSVLVASADYLARRGTPRHPRELAEHDCLVYLRDATSASWTLARVGRKGRPEERVTVPVSGPLKANNSETLREAALAGLGLALLPDFSAGAQRPLADWQPALLPVLPDWQPQGFFGGRVYAVRPWSAHVPRAVQYLVDHLRQSFQAGWPV
jgi:DNA-binding transcriptional LysR family regulator